MKLACARIKKSAGLFGTAYGLEVSLSIANILSMCVKTAAFSLIAWALVFIAVINTCPFMMKFESDFYVGSKEVQHSFNVLLSQSQENKYRE